MVEIEQLTNEEIRDQLMVRGCDPGPVIGSTRSVYANKLRRLLEGESESNVMAPPERSTSDAAGIGTHKSSPKRRDVSHSPQKSRSPRRTTRSSAQEVIGLTKVQNIPLDSKISQASPKTTDVSAAKSRITSDLEQSLPKSCAVQPSVPTPKSRVNHEFKTHTEVSKVPESHHSPSKASVNAESSSLNLNSSKMSKSYLFETISEVYHTTPSTRFTSLRDDWENGKVSDGSDDDLRGEESSRILLPSWKEDHAYSNQSPMARRGLDENSKIPHIRASLYNSEAMFENSCDGYGNRRSGLVEKEKAPRNYGKICLILLLIITGVIFVFFVVQNYEELEYGESNNEEF